jgi:Tol biopolymer transport system component
MRRTSLFITTLSIVLIACERPTDPGVSLSERTAPGFWHAAVSVDPGGSLTVNTLSLEGCPYESPDGRSLYFASNRDGTLHIWVSHRTGNGEWGAPEKLDAPVNSSATEFCPTPLPGDRLMFVSTRVTDGSCGAGTADMYETRLDPVEGWTAPRNLGCAVNSSANEFSPSYVAAGGGMLFFSSDRTGKHAIYISTRGDDGEWQAPELVEGINLPDVNSARPNVSFDGREIVFDSDRSGGLGGFDVWYASRQTPFGPWSAPVNAGSAVNSTAAETRPSFSRDGRRLYFGSTRTGNSDIYVSQRR